MSQSEFKAPANQTIVLTYYQPDSGCTGSPVAIITRYDVSKAFTLFVNDGKNFVKKGISKVPFFEEAGYD